jgi:hypothetical protein
MIITKVKWYYYKVTGMYWFLDYASYVILERAVLRLKTV